MNPELLEMLACPVCHQSLKFEQTKAKEKSNKITIQKLVCQKCNIDYPVEDKIIQLITENKSEGK